MPQLYVPIRLRDFISGSTAKSDIFICLPGGNHYIKVLHKGQAFDPARLSNYKEHHIDTLYLAAQDFAKYVDDNAKLGNEILAKGSLDAGKSVRFLNRIADSVLSELVYTEINAESLGHARSVTSHFLTGLKKQPTLQIVFSSLEEMGEGFARHSIGVTMIATMMAMRMRWAGDKTLDIVQCGGFLHDIGFRELPMELHDKPRAMMSQEELKLYESHPYRGVRILESIPTFPSEVVSIIYDHHEVSNGNGFPRALKTDRIYPLARMVSLADLFCKHALSSRFNQEPKPAPSVVDHLEKGHSHDFPYEFWDALNYIVGRDNTRKKKAK